eukprot:gene9894-10051_t
MGSLISKSTGAAADVKGEAEPQKVTFAEPPVTTADPTAIVLKRDAGLKRRGRAAAGTIKLAPTAAGTTPSSSSRPKRAARTLPSAAPVPAINSTPKRSRKAAAGAAAAVAKEQANDELVVVGTALVLAPPPAAAPASRVRTAVPARKVGMKRVARKSLKPVANMRNSGRGKKA